MEKIYLIERLIGMNMKGENQWVGLEFVTALDLHGAAKKVGITLHPRSNGEPRAQDEMWAFGVSPKGTEITLKELTELSSPEDLTKIEP